ncbi:MAG: hypothetical protein QMC93_01535 [Patescibacteria group bacterium]|nr:hypothetical protein [Patescibacteria group bacterium]
MVKEVFGKIIPRPKPKPSRMVNFLFYFSLILIIFLIGAYFFLAKEISSLEEKNQGLEGEIAKVKEEKIGQTEKEILATEQRIKIFKELLKKHKISSNFFPFLENLTHPKVQFTRLILNSESYQIALEGKTENFQFLAEQIFILREDKNIKSLNLNSVSLDREGKTQFTLTFSLPPQIFQSTF